MLIVLTGKKYISCFILIFKYKLFNFSVNKSSKGLLVQHAEMWEFSECIEMF